METSTEKQLPVSNNLMEVESAHGPPENMLNGELETIIMASIQTLKRSNKNVEKMKFSNWLTIHLRKNFMGDFRTSFIPVNKKAICETKCTWKKNLFVTAKRIPVEQRKQSNCWYLKQRR